MDIEDCIENEETCFRYGIETDGNYYYYINKYDNKEDYYIKDYIKEVENFINYTPKAKLFYYLENYPIEYCITVRIINKLLKDKAYEYKLKKIIPELYFFDKDNNRNNIIRYLFNMLSEEKKEEYMGIIGNEFKYNNSYCSSDLGILDRRDIFLDRRSKNSFIFSINNY